jgi:hypothetical protein
MTKDEALKMAVEALEAITLETISHDDYWDLVGKAIQACKEALAQPAQEPVGWMVFDVNGSIEFVPNDNNKFFTKQTTAKQKPIPLYTTIPVVLTVPLDKSLDMQRRLNALEKMSDNAKELGLDYD